MSRLRLLIASTFKSPKFRQTLAVFCLMFFSVCVNAQSLALINGIVKNDKNEPLSGATVFLANTQSITSTGNDGAFSLGKLKPGTFQLVVRMMGYSVYAAIINARANMPPLAITLSLAPIDLNEVKIKSSDPNWSDEYAIFKDNFLGLSKNGRNCKILNPEIIHFKQNKQTGALEAHTNDFLIIENAELGYRLKYLLKAFTFKYRYQITNYDGEMLFEEMEGADKQLQKWKQNRLDVYNGSLMQFFRALYVDEKEPRKKGFIANVVLEGATDLSTDGLNARMRPPLIIDERPVKFDTIVSIVDSALISLKFHSTMVISYYGKSIKKAKDDTAQNATKTVPLNKAHSSLKLVLNRALIDSKGNFTDYRAFLIRGYWADLRIGDQLPLDYQP